ncbi:MAG: hypothetical protein FWE70_01405 [Oscillospiraceae bacterium]|nr:hypothetical protein [Oscillospiraceae bacterium]
MVMMSSDRELTVSPLETVKVAAGGAVSVCDGKGREYFRSEPGAGAAGRREVSFAVGGALGRHTVRMGAPEGGGAPEELSFLVDAKSGVSDSGGEFGELFRICERTMRYRYSDPTDTPEMAGVGAITHKGVKYLNFVVWILDHLHTAKGFKYLSPHADGLVNLLKEIQREDGMIWSFIYGKNAGYYYMSAYERPYGYAVDLGDNVAARQPVENHCEANYVECVYLVWQSTGDDAWMAGMLDSCVKALDYGRYDKARWSERFGLLKKGYTIDSWDFQPGDASLAHFDLGIKQQIDHERTKFTVFYGDNTGYAYACDVLAEMLAKAGRAADARAFADRAAGIRERLDALAWNGRFYTHRVEEDESAVRDFGGTDTAGQVSFSNCYTLNRNCTHEQAAAIIRTYQGIRAALPHRSPGEFYAIYPPFETDVFDEGGACAKWQYMNGGVHAHAAGELARGAFEHGFEGYGADILRRVLGLGKEDADGFLRFAYTGAYEDGAPPAQKFSTVDLAPLANMGLSSEAAEGSLPWLFDGLKNDIRRFPVGSWGHKGVPYLVADPAANGGKAAVAVRAGGGRLPGSVRVPIGSKVGSLFALHSTGGRSESGLVGLHRFLYEDGTEATKAVMYGRDVTNFWFSELRESDRSGLAWRGDSDVAYGVGVCWAEYANPFPERPVEAVEVTAGPDGASYALLALTVADRPSYREPPLESTGGPDNWSGGLVMAALMEGLGGVKDKGTAYADASISPRWAAAGVDSASLTARYAASGGYVSYRYAHDADAREITVTATGSGDSAEVRVLLPEGARCVVSAMARFQGTGRSDGAGYAPAAFRTDRVEDSTYAAVPIAFPGVTVVKVTYE